MAKRTFNAKELVADIRSGLSRSALLSKYQISHDELSILIRKLLLAKAINETDLRRFTAPLGASPVFECPECGTMYPDDFDQCPDCGAFVATIEAEMMDEEPTQTLVEELISEKDSVVAVYRGNMQRTGFYDSKGVRQLSELKWKFKTQGWISSSPVFAYDNVYFGSWDGGIYAANIGNGERAWSFATKGPVSSSAAVARGKGLFWHLRRSANNARSRNRKARMELQS